MVMAVVTCLFSVFGGMESVVIADNIQTILMVIAVITVGSLAFVQPEIGSFSNLLTLDHSIPLLVARHPPKASSVAMNELL